MLIVVLAHVRYACKKIEKGMYSSITKKVIEMSVANQAWVGVWANDI